MLRFRLVCVLILFSEACTDLVEEKQALRRRKVYVAGLSVLVVLVAVSVLTFHLWIFVMFVCS